jgi:putative endopeptidase
MRYLLFLIAVIFIVSCNNDKKADVVAVNMDTTVDPSQDFFLYANGGWIKKNPIPSDQGAWGIGNLVVEENLKRLREISENAAKAKGAKGSNEQKIGDFWATAMDSAKIEQLALKPLQPYLDKINAITDANSLIRTSAELKKIGSSTLFSDYITQDDKNSDQMILRLNQGGLGLPEREYYFKDDSATINIRNQYVSYIANTLSMAGDDSVRAMAEAKNILALETKLALASRKLADLRDPDKNYNKMAIADLPKMSSNIDWANFLSITGISKIDSVIVGQPEYFKALNDIIKSTPIETWKSELRFNLISDFSNSLPDKFGIAAFNFNKLFTGATERRPRWKRVIYSEENVMGEMLGQLYVKEFFNETAKKR